MTGDDLREWMGRYNLTRKDVAAMTGTHDRTVTYWLNNHHQIPLPVVIIAKALDRGLVTQQWLAKQVKSFASRQ